MIQNENHKEKVYIAIDLKSFYASVECMERGLDPMTTNLIVADSSRTEKTICLAVSPSLKSYGVPGRPRLFEVIQIIQRVNRSREMKNPLTGSSWDNNRLLADPHLAVDYIIAPPRMAYYMEYSTRIYNVYLKYAAPEDIHVYSIDEVFIDITNYLPTWNMTPRELTMKIILDVLNTTGITATAGIGTNLYLCKVAMDIVAKKIPPDKNGVRIAELDEMSYRKTLWDHRPLTDFWRIGKGYSKKLESRGLYTMGDIARCSIGPENYFYNEDLLYKMFGVNAELLIDHAWGWENCTIAEIKAYRPENNSLSSGQVLTVPYDNDKAMLVAKEMADLLALDLAEKRLVTDQIVLTIGYDIENITDPYRKEKYKGEIVLDGYGRQIPKHGHGTKNLDSPTASARKIIAATTELFQRITDPSLLIRRITIGANHVIREENIPKKEEIIRLDLFTDYQEEERKKEQEAKALAKEKNMQQAMISIKKKYGKNAILRGMNLEQGATAMERNNQIGGHRAGPNRISNKNKGRDKQ